MKPCKHKFQARYDEKWTTLIEELVTKGQSFNQVGSDVTKPYLKEKNYIYDICIRCGKIVKRV